MPIYHKLVRDKIPSIIEASGKAYTAKVLGSEEYIDALHRKFSEELEEVTLATSSREALEELADVLEVMNALCQVHGATLEEVEELRREKVLKRGGFDQKIMLVEVVDDEL